MVSDLEMDLLFMFLKVSLVRKLGPADIANVVCKDWNNDDVGCHDWKELSVSSVNSVVLTLPRPRAPQPLSQEDCPPIKLRSLVNTSSLRGAGERDF